MKNETVPTMYSGLAGMQNFGKLFLTPTSASDSVI